MWSRKALFTFCVFSLALLPLPAHAGTNLKVIVKNSSGRGVQAQGSLMFTDPATNRPVMKPFTTDASGLANLVLEQNGTWSIMLQAQGYGPSVMEQARQGKTTIVAAGVDLVHALTLSPITGVGQIEVAVSNAEPGQLVTATVEDAGVAEGSTDPLHIRATWSGLADVFGAGKITIFNVPVAPANAFHLDLTSDVEGESPGITTLPIAQPIADRGIIPVTAELPAVAVCGSSLCRLLRRVQEIDFGTESIRSFRFKPAIRVTPEQLFTLFGEALGLRLNDGDSFRESRNFTDFLGYTNRRYQQYYKDLEVIGAEYHLEEKEGVVEYASNNILLGLNLPTAPVLSEAAALQAAELAVGAASYPWDVDPANNPPPRGQLAIASKGFAMTTASAHLVWVFTIITDEPFGSHDVHIDALTGEVVNVVDNIRTFGLHGLLKLAETAKVSFYQNIASTGESIQYGQVNFTADLDPDGKARLTSQKDGALPARVGIFDAREHTRNEPVVQLFIDDNLEGASPNNFLDPFDDLGVSVHWGIQQSMAYFQDEFGWSGWDGKGNNLIRAFVTDKLDSPYGAGHIKGTDILFFEKESGLQTTALTVVGHEFTHMISKAMIYEKGENCAIEEGFADLFGNAIAMYTHEKLGVTLTGYDDLNFGVAGYPNTYSFPDTYLGDFYEPPDGVDPCHKNCTIITYWAWLLEHGGSGTNDVGNAYNVVGVGGPDARKVAYQTMKKLPAEADFLEARKKSIDVAKNALKSPAVTESVIEAWHAVGVGDKSKLMTIPATGAKKVEPWPAQLAYEYQPGKSIAKFQISKSATFSPWTTETSVAAASYVQPDGKILIPAKEKFNLDPGDAYLWRVCFKKGDAPPTADDPGLVYKGPSLVSDDACDGTWSATRYFWTDPKTVALVSPGKNNQVHPWGTVFKWQPVAGATAYDIHVKASDSDILKIPVDPGNPANQEGALIKGTANLKIDQEYEWDVVAKGPPGTAEGKESPEVQKITTKIPTTALSTPANGTSGLYPWGITLKSAKTSGAKGYKFWLSNDPNFSTEIAPNLLYTGVLGSPNVKVNISQANAKGPIYWAVQPKGPPLPDVPDGEWGDATTPPWAFTVDYALTKPKLKYPQYFAKIPFNSSQVQFVWAPVPEASKYSLTVYKRLEGDVWINDALIVKKVAVNAKDVAVVDGGIQSLVTAPSTDSDPATPNVAEGYCWRVEAEPAAGGQYIGLPSEVWCYDLGPDIPVLGKPLNTDSPVDYTNTQFVWNSQYAPYGYVIWIFLYKSGVQEDIFFQFVGSSKTFSKQLVPGSEYHWIASALTEPMPSGSSPQILDKLIMSSSQTFTTKTEASPEPTPPPSDDPQVPNAQCNVEQEQVAGGAGMDIREFNLNANMGTFYLKYDTATVVDEIKVFYEGQEIWSSGCTSTKGEKSSGPITFKGTSTTVTVQVIGGSVNGGCGYPYFAGTAWEYTLVCP